MQKGDKVTILGDGGWATSLSLLLSKKGILVSLWGVFPDYIEFLKADRENRKFLPGFKIPDEVIITSDMEQALNGSGAAIVAIPTQFLRQVLQKQNGLKKIPQPPMIISAAKGIENKTFKRPSEIIREELKCEDIVVLSGPTIAREVAEGAPASAVVASDKEMWAKEAQGLFMSESFRIYTSSDPIGVELGGALKNIIAIAAGISDGLGFGTNAKAALFTRGLVEMKRLGVVLGAEEETFNGLSGIGDLLTTCISSNSRNRYVGEETAKGKRLPDILNKMEMVAEGVDTTRAVHELSQRKNIDAPITNEVYKVLFEDKDPLSAVNDLMTRSKKAE